MLFLATIYIWTKYRLNLIDMKKLTIGSNFGTWGLSLQAFCTLICRFGWSDSTWTWSLRKCNSIILAPAVFLSPIKLISIRSSCQRSITSTSLVPTQGSIQISKMYLRCIGHSFVIWRASDKRRSTWNLKIILRLILRRSILLHFAISLIEVVLISLEHHF